MIKRIFSFLFLTFILIGCTSSVETDEFKSHSISFRKFPSSKLVVEAREYYTGIYTIGVTTNLFNGAPVDSLSVDDEKLQFTEDGQILSLPKGQFNRIYRKLTSVGHEVKVTSGSQNFTFTTSDIGKSL